ncbi:glycosyltransferase [Hutsoniella sourekii]
MSLYIKEQPSYFKKSIESMLNQTIKPEEIVLVVDGPLTAELDSLVSYYRNQYKKLMTVVKLEKNKGLGLALNEGLKVARNELVARMDTDDISYLDRCEKQLEIFRQNNSIDVVGTLTSEFYESPDQVISTRLVPEHHNDIEKFSKTRSPFNHPTVMYRRSSVLAVGGYRNILRNEDLDLFIRMIIEGYKMYNIQEELLYFRSDINNYKRRKSWSNNKNYIKVIINSYKIGHSSLFDLLYVLMTQVGMYLAPMWLLKLISDNYLRKKVKNGR